MRITDVVVESYRAPIDPPISNGRYTYATIDLCLVRISTDEGITGLGVGDGGVTLQGAPEMIRGTVASLQPALLGENPLHTERIWSKLWSPKLLGRRGFTTRVVSAVDLALWDLKGRVFGVPVATLLGRFRERLPVYVAGGYYREGGGLPELADELSAYVAAGAQAVKIKIGGASLREDMLRIRTARQAIGDDTKLLVDANNAYRLHEAIDIAHRLEEFDVFWFEEPLMPDDYRGHAILSRQARVPIAAGENEYTRYGFRDLIEHQSATILNPDAQFVGGVSEFMKVAALAQAHDLPIAPHGNPGIHVHLATAIPNGLIVEYSKGPWNGLWDRLFGWRLEIVDGMVAPPDRPGFGLEPDEKALAEWRVL